MTRICPKFLDANPADRSAQADILLREEPEEEEEEDDPEEDDEDEDADEGYSE